MTIDTLSPPEVPAAGSRGPGPAVTGVPFSEVAAALAVEFPQIPTDVIERCVADEGDRFRAARIVAFLDVLVHKAARERLRSSSTPPLAKGGEMLRNEQIRTTPSRVLDKERIRPRRL